MQLLGFEPKSSGRADSTLNHPAIAPVLCTPFRCIINGVILWVKALQLINIYQKLKCTNLLTRTSISRSLF